MSVLAPPGQRRAGYLLGVFGAALFGWMNFAVHWGQALVPSAQLVFFRSLFALLVLTPFCLPLLSKAFSRGAGWLWLRSVAGSLALLCSFWTLQQTSVGNARALGELAPLFVLLLSWRLFGERLAPRELFGVGLILGGAVLLQLDVRGAVAPAAFWLGIAGAAAGGVAHLALRQAAREFSSRLVVWCLSLAGCLISLMAPSVPWRWPESRNAVLLLLGVGASGMVAQLAVTMSFARLPAGVANALLRTALLFSVGCQLVFLRQWPTPAEWGCYGLVLAGAAFLQHHREQPLEAPRVSAK